MADEDAARESEPTDTGTTEPAEETPDAEAAVDSVAKAASGVVEEVMDLPDLADAAINGSLPAGMQMLDDVELDVQIELGRSRMFVEDVLRLAPDSVIELDRAAGDPVDIFVNNRHVARGEVLVLNESFCVRISEIIRDPGGEPEPE